MHAYKPLGGVTDVYCKLRAPEQSTFVTMPQDEAQKSWPEPRYPEEDEWTLVCRSHLYS